MWEWLVEGDWFFRARGTCGHWTAWEQVTYITAEAATGASYLALAAMLELFISFSNVQRRWITHLFAAFILVCGVSHFVEGVGSFWYPNYRLFIVINSVRALLSVITSILFPVFIVSIAKVPTLAQVEEAWYKLQSLNDEFKSALLMRLAGDAQVQDLAKKLAEATSELAKLAQHDEREPGTSLS